MAKGSRRANYTKSLGEGKNWVLKPAEEWVVTECPAIVSEELWNDCNKILEIQTKPRNKPGKKPVHLFTNIVFCGCGGKMYVPSNSKKYVCTSCKQTKIPAEDLEEIYFENLKTFLLTEDHLKEYLTKTNQMISEKETQIETLKLELKKTTVDMEKLLDLHLSGEIPKEGFGRRYNPLDQKVQQIEHSLPELQAEIDFLKMESLNQDFLLQEAHNLRDRWSTFSFDVKRRTIEEVTKSITIDGDEIEIRFSYTPTLSGNAPDSQRNRRDS
jgi:site-specific DNA recombinase